MLLMKRLFLLIISVFCFLSFADDRTEIETCLKTAMKAGMSMDWITFKKYCSQDYVKLAQDKKVFDRKMLDRVAFFFERMKSPDLTFSELVKLNFMMKGRNLPESQLANYRKLDSSLRGKAQVLRAKKQIKKAEQDMLELLKEIWPKIEYGPQFIRKDIAVWFYKLDFGSKIKGVLVLRKENNKWKLYREYAISDTDYDKSAAVETEVRKFVEKSNELTRNFVNFVDVLQDCSTEGIFVYPDGKSMDYQQALKRAKFYDMLQNGDPTMAEAAPLWMESCGITVTSEMLAEFADDKNGSGKKWLRQCKENLFKHRSDLKKSGQTAVKHIFLFEDCALVMDNISLPNAGNTKRISLLKKNKGKYLIYRSVSRKNN